MRTPPKLVLCVAAVLFVLPIAAAQSVPAGDERILLDSVNRDRAAMGLSPLRWDNALANAARRHAEVMAQRGAISHQFPGEAAPSVRAEAAGARFDALAENVAVGPTPAAIHTMWMNSPPHRQNLLDPNLNSIGIAVAGHEGQLYAVEDFSDALPALSLTEQEGEVGQQIKARGLVLKSSEEARRACADNSAIRGRPIYWMRYSTGDLENLPCGLQEKIGSGQYRAAAVGACPAKSGSGFALYLITVLLYP